MFINVLKVPFCSLLLCRKRASLNKRLQIIGRVGWLPHQFALSHLSKLVSVTTAQHIFLWFDIIFLDKDNLFSKKLLGFLLSNLMSFKRLKKINKEIKIKGPM